MVDTLVHDSSARPSHVLRGIEAGSIAIKECKRRWCAPPDGKTPECIEANKSVTGVAEKLCQAEEEDD